MRFDSFTYPQEITGIEYICLSATLQYSRIQILTAGWYQAHPTTKPSPTPGPGHLRHVCFSNLAGTSND